MFSFPAGKVQRTFFDLKIFGSGADSAAKSRDRASEERIDYVCHTRAPAGMTAARRKMPLNLRINEPMVYFFSPCENDQANHGLRDEHTPEGLMA
jgi:hypothetical protein